MSAFVGGVVSIDDVFKAADRAGLLRPTPEGGDAIARALNTAYVIAARLDDTAHQYSARFEAETAREIGRLGKRLLAELGCPSLAVARRSADPYYLSGIEWVGKLSALPGVDGLVIGRLPIAIAALVDAAAEIRTETRKLGRRPKEEGQRFLFAAFSYIYTACYNASPQKSNVASRNAFFKFILEVAGKKTPSSLHRDKRFPFKKDWRVVHPATLFTARQAALSDGRVRSLLRDGPLLWATMASEERSWVELDISIGQIACNGRWLSERYADGNASTDASNKRSRIPRHSRKQEGDT